MILIHLLVVGLTILTIVFQTKQWLRWLAVISCFADGAFSLLGLTVIGHLSMTRDHALLSSTALYADAYRAGLAAAQERVRGFVLGLLAPYACLIVLALIPAVSVRSRSQRSHASFAKT